MLKPLHDYVVLEVIDESHTKSGIIIPDTSKDQTIGKVIAVGPGKITDSGQVIACSVKVNDTVLFNKYAGTKVNYGNCKYLLVHNSDILAIY